MDGILETDEERLASGQGPEEGQHQVGEDVAIAVEGRYHQGVVTGQHQGEGSVDQVGLVGDRRVAQSSRVHLLLEHPLVDSGDGELGASEDGGPGACGIVEGVLDHP